MKKPLRIIFGAAIILLSLCVVGISSTFPEAVVAGRKIPGPAFFPMLLAVILVPCGIHQIVGGLRTEREERWVPGLGALNGTIIVLSLILYVVVMDWIGYALSTFLFSLFLLLRLKVPFFKAATVAVITVGFILVVFGRIFLIQLPAGELGLPW